MHRFFTTDQRLAEVLAASALIFVALVLLGLGRPAQATANPCDACVVKAF